MSNEREKIKARAVLFIKTVPGHLSYCASAACVFATLTLIHFPVRPQNTNIKAKAPEKYDRDLTVMW